MVMANVAWIPYQCRCCGVVVDNHEIRRVLKAGDIMECLQELSGTITDTTDFTWSIIRDTNGETQTTIEDRGVFFLRWSNTKGSKA